jgi:ribonucleotide reductase beta subunit family protein with ferritin-like domain
MADIPISAPLIHAPLSTDNRRTARPVGRPKLYAHYDLQRNSFWTDSTITKIEDDIPVFRALKPSEQNMIKNVLILFDQADVMASKIFGGGDYLGPLGDIYEVKQIMNYQTMMEDIHAIQYSRYIDEYIPDPQERATYRNNIESHPFIGKIIDWMYKNISPANVASNIVCMAMFEGVLFTGAFAIIFAFRKLIALRTGNDYISRDEGFHHVTSALLYELILPPFRLSAAHISRMTREFGDLVCNFMVDIVPDDSTCGINKRNIVEYIHYQFDNNLRMLEYPPIYHDKNPYEDWFKLYRAPTSTAVHERHTATYAKVEDRRLKSNWARRTPSAGSSASSTRKNSDTEIPT